MDRCLRESMDTESPDVILTNTESHIQHQENIIMVTIGTTEPAPATSNLIYGNEEISFLSKFYNNASTNKF